MASGGVFPFTFTRRTTETPTLYSPSIGTTRSTLSATALVAAGASTAPISALETKVAVPVGGSAFVCAVGGALCAQQTLAASAKIRYRLFVPCMLLLEGTTYCVLKVSSTNRF